MQDVDASNGPPGENREGEGPIISPAPWATRNGESAPSSGPDWLWPVTFLAVAVQMFLAAKLASGTVGFDHAGTSGLDYGAAMGLGGIYAIAFSVGGTSALVLRAWKTAGLQLALASALGAIVSTR